MKSGKDVSRELIRKSTSGHDGREQECARYFGIHPNTVRKMCQFAAPPGYWRTPAPVSPMLAPFVAIIDAILEADKQVHVKQRHTAVRIRERLCGEDIGRWPAPTDPGLCRVAELLPV